MVYWLLVELLPIRLITLVVLVGVGLQVGGVDVVGMTVTPLLDWLTQEVANDIWPW